MQKCGPKPNATWRLALSRVRSNVRVGEATRVPVGGPDPGDDGAAGRDRAPADLYVVDGVPHEVAGGGGPAQSFLDEVGGSAWGRPVPCRTARRSMSACTVPETVCGVVTLAPSRML